MYSGTLINDLFALVDRVNAEHAHADWRHRGASQAPQPR